MPDVITSAFDVLDGFDVIRKPKDDFDTDFQDTSPTERISSAYWNEITIVAMIFSFSDREQLSRFRCFFYDFLGGYMDTDDKERATPTSDEMGEVAAKIFDSARSGEADILQAVIERGVPSNLRNERGDSLIMLAAYHGHADAVASRTLCRPDGTPERELLSVRY
jgi:ankyrin repeat protein